MATKLINFNILDNKNTPEKQTTGCIIIGIGENQSLSPTAKQLDKASRGFISAVLKNGDIEGSLGQTLLLQNIPNVLADRVLLIGTGDKKTPYTKIIPIIITALNNTKTKDSLLCLTDFIPDCKSNSDFYWPVRQTIEITHHILYDFNDFKSDFKKTNLDSITLAIPESELLKTAITQANAISEAIIHTKDLGNLPANICTPTYMAEQAKKLAKTNKKIKCAILEEADMAKLKMGLLLSVTKGTREPAKFITLEYTGAKTKASQPIKPIVLVGKGVTFDTGGNSLKPALGMIGMKYDMCGAATVLGVIEAAAKLDLPVNIVGLMPTCENMPGGNASRPDDIVTSMAGITVEILNTDAEGRLILADALTYAQRYDPKIVIDIATLTGACVAALGNHATGLLSNHPPLAQDLLQAGIQSGDRAWELPLWEEYEKLLESKFADISNVSGGSGPNAGTITAACFLAKFTKQYHWAHLDVAGTACYFNGDQKGATGRPIPLLIQYILNKL